MVTDNTVAILQMLVDDYKEGINTDDLATEAFALYLTTIEKTAFGKIDAGIAQIELEEKKAEIMQEELKRGSKVTDARNQVTLQTLEQEHRVMELENLNKLEMMKLDAIKEYLRIIRGDYKPKQD